MFVQSNDLFFAPELGIPLFDEMGRPMIGDVTMQIDLWDAGTEQNEAPGVGVNQAPRQSGPNMGEMETNPVALVSDMFYYPDVNDLIRVVITLSD